MEKFLHFEEILKDIFLGKVVKMKEKKNKKSSIKHHHKATVACHGKRERDSELHALNFGGEGFDKTRIKD